MMDEERQQIQHGYIKHKKEVVIGPSPPPEYLPSGLFGNQLSPIVVESISY